MCFAIHCLISPSNCLTLHDEVNIGCVCQVILHQSGIPQGLVDEVVLADDATMDTLEMALDQLLSGQEYVDTSTDEFRVRIYSRFWEFVRVLMCH